MDCVAIYDTTINALKNNVRAPRAQIGITCHDMILDLMTRAGMITTDEAEWAGHHFGSSTDMARALWATPSDEAVSGKPLIRTIKYDRGLIVALCKPTALQNPAHSVVSLSGTQVAGYNNVQSTSIERNAGLDFTRFYFSQFVMDDVTVRITHPQTAARRVKALKLDA